MKYYQLYEQLSILFNQPNIAEIKDEQLNVKILHHQFSSIKGRDYLLGNKVSQCSEHGDIFKEDSYLDDAHIDSNNNFSYHIIQTLKFHKSSGVIFLFHGLNEKKWDKYLPWAYQLAQETNKAIILFPLAFHMDRAPLEWSMRKEMHEVSELRREQIPYNKDTSYVNAAISKRLYEHPQRLFWSGMQTYTDIITFIETLRKGEIANIDANASIDLFGYSIGSYFSMILKMANPKGYLSNARLFIFCGGMTIDRMFPISKYIMDAASAIQMQQTFATLLSSDFEMDDRLAHYQRHTLHPQESWLKTMIRFNYYQDERENRLKEIAHQVKALVLKKDEVTPPFEARNTLQGAFGDIPIVVEMDDYDYKYSHMNPFSLIVKDSEKVDDGFTRFINEASQWLI